MATALLTAVLLLGQETKKWQELRQKARFAGDFLLVIGSMMIWLVVWLPFFIFPYIGNNHPNWHSYFSEGFKPPTRFVIGIIPKLPNSFEWNMTYFSLKLVNLLLGKRWRLSGFYEECIPRTCSATLLSKAMGPWLWSEKGDVHNKNRGHKQQFRCVSKWCV